MTVVYLLKYKRMGTLKKINKKGLTKTMSILDVGEEQSEEINLGLES